MNNVCAHNLDGAHVVPTLRDDEVCIALGGLDELFMHRLEDVEIAVKHHLCGAPSLYCITLNDANETLVGVGINEYLQVHEVAQLLLPQRHNAFDDDNLARLYMHGFGQTVADEVAVSRLLDATPLSQSLYLLGEEFPVESVRMVEVDTLSFFRSEVRGVVVVRILRYECHSVCGKRLENLLYDCCLAGTCASGDADDIHDVTNYNPLPSPPRGSYLRPPLGEVGWGLGLYFIVALSM